MKRKSIEVWLHGLGSAFIGGGATAISAMIIEPATFNLTTGLKSMAALALISGIVNASFYLRASPLPVDPPKGIKPPKV